MNTIKLCGGLGNQLFQYAFGRVQKENGIDVEYDRMWYDSRNAKNPPRFYSLDKFYIDVKLSPRRNNKKIIREDGFNPDLLYMDGFNFNGYWQYPAYYDNILPILQNELWIKKEYYTAEFLEWRQEIILNNNSVAIHVRRGDYLLLDDFPVLLLDYYQNALKKLGGDVYMFSDDMRWCEEHFTEVKFIHLDEHFDFELMKLCRHNVISRSSFSWWAAYLNANPSKVVIAPKQQIHCKVREEAQRNKPGIFDPDTWIHAN